MRDSDWEALASLRLLPRLPRQLPILLSRRRCPLRPALRQSPRRVVLSSRRIQRPERRLWWDRRLTSKYAKSRPRFYKSTPIVSPISSLQIRENPWLDFPQDCCEEA